MTAQTMRRAYFRGPAERRHNFLGVKYGNPLPSTVEFLKELGSFRRVPWGCSVVSKLPTVSCEYRGCTALLLLDDSGMNGHAHVYATETLTDVREYVGHFKKHLGIKRAGKARIFAFPDWIDIRDACMKAWNIWI